MTRDRGRADTARTQTERKPESRKDRKRYKKIQRGAEEQRKACAKIPTNHLVVLYLLSILFLPPTSVDEHAQGGSF